MILKINGLDENLCYLKQSGQVVKLIDQSLKLKSVRVVYHYLASHHGRIYTGMFIRSHPLHLHPYLQCQALTCKARNFKKEQSLTISKFHAWLRLTYPEIEHRTHRLLKLCLTHLRGLNIGLGIVANHGYESTQRESIRSTRGKPTTESQQHFVSEHSHLRGSVA